MNKVIRELKKQAKAYKQSYYDDIEKANSEYRYEDARIIEEQLRGLYYKQIGFQIDIAETEYYRDQLDNFNYPIPLESEFWEDEFIIPGEKVLSSKGISECKKILMECKRERRESFTSFASALTGILGVVVAIIAMATPFQNSNSIQKFQLISEIKDTINIYDTIVVYDTIQIKQTIVD